MGSGTPVLIGALVILFILLFAGVPIFAALGIGSTIVLLLIMKQPPAFVPTQMFSSIDSYTLLAIPLFLLAGEMMTRGGVSKYLVGGVDKFLCHIPGGMAMTTVLTCMIFAAMSGSSPATAAAIGAIMLKPMAELGYSKSFSAGLVACAGTLGILIPPSINMIIYSSITGTSVGKLFIAGVLPGVLLGFLLMATAVFIAWRRKYGIRPAASWRERFQGLGKAAPSLTIPAVIFGGIYGGVFTPTEAAAVACLFAFILGTVVYRELKWQQIKESFIGAARTTCMIFMIIATAILFGKVLTVTQSPQKLITAVTASGIPLLGLLMLVNLVYFGLGCVMEIVCLMYITVPLFFPAMAALGVDPIHFGIIVVLNAELALVTPPIGFNLYVLSGASGEPIDSVVKGALPFYIPMVIGLLVITYWPSLSLFLPAMMR